MEKEESTKIDKSQKVKTKVRFTSLDIAAMVAEMQCLLGLRVSNIYDINPTTYIIKAARSEQKYQLLIENGVRFHFTEQKPDKKRIPSGFTMRFRRHLRSKRVESVRQVGVQRVIVMSFGSQTFANHLILQLYSQGNIILTDHQYRIIQCIRSHEFSDKVKTAVGQIYPFQQAANIYIENINISSQALDKIVQQPPKQEQQQPQPTKKKGKEAKGGFKAKDIIFKMIPCLFPQVIDHILTSKGINPDTKLQGEQSRQTVLRGAWFCYEFLKNFLNVKQKGYLYKKGEDYFEFSPFANCKLQNWEVTQTQSFGAAVSEYFSKYKKSAHEEEQAFEELAWKKYQQIRKDQEERVKRLVQEQQKYGGKAELIEKNVEQVEAVIKIISTMEANGYSWEAMQRMIAQSRKSGDPLANMIHNLTPAKRLITVLLSDTAADEPGLCPLTPVELNVDYNAYTNATMYYESRKKQQQKEARTRQASGQVLKLAEKDALKKIQKKKNQILLKAVPTRKQMWFQKFYWFVTSEGWLVISGRDSHQNELLVKRYMRAGDLYMHSDYGGAASTIIKGPPKAGPAPTMTLQQAAIFTVCRSKAWDTKIISSAWWVYHDQVSKSAPTGEFLPTGSFMIRGKRNFIHPNRMEMGLTLLFRLDNESMLRRIEKQKQLAQIKEQVQPVVSQQGLVKKQSTDQPEQEEFAIIDLQAQARLAKQKKRERGKNNEKAADKSQKPELKKQASVKQKEKESDQEEQEDSSEDERQNKKDMKKKDNKKDSKKNDKGDKAEEQGQKHKNRNKKKLQKLEKYMEEQDEDQRQIIMKMLGAKEMKHLQKEQEEQQPQRKNQKGKKLPKKKGLEKYIGSNGNQNQVSIDTNKVLFLKDKKKQKQESSDDEDMVIQKEEVKPTQQPVQAPQTQEKGETKEASELPKQEGTTEQQPVQQQDKQDESEQQVQPKQETKVQQEVVDEKTIDSQLSELMRLAGRVQGQDKWDALIPMCAPYVTIKDNKFKVKLVPGGLKKGKAARNIMGYFAQGELQENQKAFIRALPQQEVINALIGNVKLGGAGLLKIEQKSKAEKKQKRKQQDKKAKDD